MAMSSNSREPDALRRTGNAKKKSKICTDWRGATCVELLRYGVVKTGDKSALAQAFVRCLVTRPGRPSPHDASEGGPRGSNLELYGGDPWVRLALLNVVGMVSAAALLPFVEVPNAEAWPFILGSVAIHQVYFACVALQYRFGDLSHVYPISRGTARSWSPPRPLFSPAKP